MTCNPALTLSILLTALATATPAAAEWHPATPAVAAAAKEPRIAAVLAAVDRIDAALIVDDRAGFAALLAPDLVVNNPQNRISEGDATRQRNAAGQIGYTSYSRTIDYAGIRGGMVVLMGEENVVPKPPNPMAGQPVRRRFTDAWRRDGGRWRLALRQATIIPPR